MNNFLRQTAKLLVLVIAAAIPGTLALVPVIGWDVVWLLLLWTVALSGLTWVFYVEAMRLKRLRDRGELELWHYPWALIVLGIGLPSDAALNVVVGAWWREAPKWRNGEILLTARLDRWARDDDAPTRQQWAQRVCRKLNKHDEGHCFAGAES